ncbi:serine hydrolase [Nocardia sp. ET3-3]|uniref:Serine hydrolase n=1 Tax=Nocardia terrae TaxID=2675851 RepID=A0A7K1V3P0_9NOCA|nr:serine hydrolase [Nocardia terrae]MVU81224.1 serine hydrolase [Nocardia terrae]
MLLGASAIAAGGLVKATVARAGVPVVGPAFDAQYRATTKLAGGRWHCLVTDLASGKPAPVVEEDADFVIEGASVQKLAIMTAVMSEVDAGRLRMSDTTTLDADMVAEGSGLYLNQAAFGDQLTIANLLTTMLQVSDNTAVRLMSRFVSGDQINETLDRLGFQQTRVVPVAGESRFYLGYTTPRENNDLLYRLASGTLLSKQSTQDVLRIMTWSAVGYTDGVRRNMSSEERARFATKHGASEDKRHDTGIMFDAAGAPLVVYSFFADQAPDADNYGATNPIVEAHATLGRSLLDTYTHLSPLQSFIDPKKIASGGH